MMFAKRNTAFFIMIVIIFSFFFGCNNQATVKIELKPSVSQSDSDWLIQQDEIILENETICFILDPLTTHFKVTDKRTGQNYFSFSENIMSNAEEYTKRACSELTLHYYEEQSDVNYMYSTADSVEMGNFSVLTNGKAIRVYYRFGTMDDVLPLVLDEQSFDTICSNIENSAIRRRLQRYYVLYSNEDKPDDFEEKLSEYPILRSQSLYIIDDGLTNVEKSDISTYLSDAGYTDEQYQKMLAALNLDLSEYESDSAGFVVPVEYTINNDGFTATVLTDRIEEKSSKYKLQKIDFLEYFCSIRDTDGYYFVPDGSGALIDFSYTMDSIELPYFGEDYSENIEAIDGVKKNLVLPVFGISMNNGGIFAVIEQAAEVAQLNVSTGSKANPFNRIYTSFSLRSIDVTDYGASMSIPIYNLFSKELVSISPKIRFILLTDKNKDYSDMAAVYREYLVENGVLSKNINSELPVFLDYICMISEDKSFLGVPYVKKTVLSTLSEITKSVQSLHEAGLKNIVVRLYGYSRSGYEHGVYNDFDLSSKIGSLKELEYLNQILLDSGGCLYLDADMQFAFHGGNDFSPSDDAARYLNRIVVYRGQYDIVTQKFSNNLRRYFISPTKYPEYTAAFHASLKSTFGNIQYPGISYGSTGLLLGGDYAKMRNIDRTKSIQYVNASLSKAKAEGAQMAFDNGNSYVLPYASHLFQVPLTCSYLDCETESVPFYEMVIYNMIPFAGTPYNMSLDGNKSLLNSIVFGAAPYAVFITESDSLLYNTQYESIWHSLQDDNRLQILISYAKQTQLIKEATENADLIDFEYLKPDISCSVYSNGVKIYINYSSSEIKINETTYKLLDLIME